MLAKFVLIKYLPLKERYFTITLNSFLTQFINYPLKTACRFFIKKLKLNFKVSNQNKANLIQNLKLTNFF
jgi:hypothetical protein